MKQPDQWMCKTRINSRRIYDIVTQSEGIKGLSNEKQSRTVQLGRDQKIAETLANIITEYESQIKTELEAGSRT